MLQRQSPSGPFVPGIVIRTRRVEVAELIALGAVDTTELNVGEPLPAGKIFASVFIEFALPTAFTDGGAAVVNASIGTAVEDGILLETATLSTAVEGRAELTTIGNNALGTIVPGGSQIVTEIDSTVDFNTLTEGDTVLRIGFIEFRNDGLPLGAG